MTDIMDNDNVDNKMTRELDQRFPNCCGHSPKVGYIYIFGGVIN